jgi:hypothetical protein
LKSQIILISEQWFKKPVPFARPGTAEKEGSEQQLTPRRLGTRLEEEMGSYAFFSSAGGQPASNGYTHSPKVRSRTAHTDIPPPVMHTLQYRIDLLITGGRGSVELQKMSLNTFWRIVFLRDEDDCIGLFLPS